MAAPSISSQTHAVDAIATSLMSARIYSPTPRNLRRLARALQAGELVAIPTETVYGLAADALNPQACRAIFRAKGRPASDPLIVHVLDLAHAEQLAVFNPIARAAVKRFWPGPLTIVLPRRPVVPDIVTSGGETVALRSPAHPLARELLKLARVPLAAPSANPFSYISPTSAAHVVHGLGQRIPYVLDGGDCEVGVESTVLDLTDPTHPIILRPGSVDAATLSRALRRPVRLRHAGGEKSRTLRAPGLLEKHYSPRTPLAVAKTLRTLHAGEAAILLRRPAGKALANIYWLSQRGAQAEIARNLYRVLREADSAGHRQIFIEQIPLAAGSLAAAINDRIRRAAARK